MIAHQRLSKSERRLPNTVSEIWPNFRSSDIHPFENVCKIVIGRFLWCKMADSCEAAEGLPQDWGSGRDRDWRG
jgi:hypothetical protein